MNNQQFVALSITVLAIFAGTFFNSSRIGDLSSSLQRQIADTRDLLRAEMRTYAVKTDSRFTAIDRKLDEILRKA